MFYQRTVRGRYAPSNDAHLRRITLTSRAITFVPSGLRRAAVLNTSQNTAGNDNVNCTFKQASKAHTSRHSPKWRHFAQRPCASCPRAATGLGEPLHHLRLHPCHKLAAPGCTTRCRVGLHQAPSVAWSEEVRIMEAVRGGENILRQIRVEGSERNTTPSPIQCRRTLRSFGSLAGVMERHLYIVDGPTNHRSGKVVATGGIRY